MIDTGVVLDGAGFALLSTHAHSENGVGLWVRDNFLSDVLTNIFFVKYYVIASITLLYFDHVITFPLEVQRVWCTRFTGASFLFLLNRYVPFFGYIPVVMGLFDPPWDIAVCKKFAPFIGALGLISNLIAAIILILRTYALYGRALWVLIVTGLFGAASVAVGGWSTSSVEGELFNFRPIVVCVPMLFHEFGLRFTWIMTFIFDIVVFGLTIARTYQYAKAHSRMRMHSDLTFLLMRDGSIYFLVMSIVNAANYILSIRIQNSFFASATGTNSILANVISVTMISRLLLNLREESVQYNRRSASRARSSTIPTLTDTNLMFTSRIIGNLTADLDYESVGSFHARDGSENYYGYSGEESDELYELQSRSTRSGFTSRSKFSGRSMLSDPRSSSGTGTITGSSSGSGSGADSGMSRTDRARQSKLTWVQSANIASSSTAGRHRMDGLLSPTTAVESHLGLLPSGEHSPQLLSPLSPATSRSIASALHQPTTLVSPHPTSPISPDHVRDLAFITMSRGEDWDGNVEQGSSENRERARQRMHFHSAGTDEAIEMSNFKRQTRPEGSYDHDLYHDHYRRAPHSLPDT